jgi:DNA-binding transcriptional ArsR family regulator
MHRNDYSDADAESIEGACRRLAHLLNNLGDGRLGIGSMSKGRGERDLEDFELVFKALAHISRRHILVVLKARGGRMTAGDIARRFSCSWPTTSRHLRILEEAGLVRVDRQGREWVYLLEAERIHRVVGGWVRCFEVTEGGKGQ